MVYDEEVTEFLEHFGIKGMRWGVRKNSRNNSSSGLSPKVIKNLKVAAGIGAGGAVLAGGIFTVRHISGSSGTIPITQASRIVNSNTSHAREAARIRSNMNRMYSEISSDFRQVERTIDPRFISDPSVFRWPQTFGS